MRDHQKTGAMIEEKLPRRSNLHVLSDDLDKCESLKVSDACQLPSLGAEMRDSYDAFGQAREIAGGGLDLLIANAGISTSCLEELNEL